MLTKPEKAKLRSEIFRHLDGIVIAPTAHALHQAGVLDAFLQKEKIDLKSLSKEFNANEGYLNVALRLMASQGWLLQELDNVKDEIFYTITPAGKFAFPLTALYEDVVKLMKFSQGFDKRKFDPVPFRKLERIFEKYRNNYGISWSENELENTVQKQILKHIEGAVIGPSTVSLGMSGMFHKYFMEASFRPEEFHSDKDSFTKLLDFFAFLNWFDEKNGTYRFTNKGLFFAKRASAYGVTVSYIPTFRQLDELIFGNPNFLRDIPEGAAEIHVDREMNVWGSGGAHSSYFKKIDEVIIELFNRPIDDQPKGIVDMGCGNGAFLEHIFNVIEQKTRRGEMLEDYPIFLVGADYNQAALKVTKANLIKADIWAKVIWGDIGRPDLLANDLKENYGIEMNELLNVRTFLDHNRIWSAPKTIDENRISNSSGAFAFRGKRIPNSQIEDNLKEHFDKWSPYIQRFGLLVIELHTIAPKLAADNVGKTAVTAYDATHGFSDQYIVELEVFYKVAAEAGLHSVTEFQTRFPNSDIATVSISLLKGKGKNQHA